MIPRVPCPQRGLVAAGLLRKRHRGAARSGSLRIRTDLALRQTKQDQSCYSLEYYSAPSILSTFCAGPVHAPSALSGICVGLTGPAANDRNTSVLRTARAAAWPELGAGSRALADSQHRATSIEMAELVEVLRAWHLWLLLGILLAIAELAGAGFVLLALGMACLAGAAAAAWTDWGLSAQILTAAIVAAVLTPLAIYRFRTSVRLRRPGPLDRGWERGRRAIVERYGGRAGVRLNGDFFPARLADGREPAEGEEVEVVGIEGITAHVRPRSKASSPGG
jgi:membrane protein implicated in regulation of membrane protease activity